MKIKREFNNGLFEALEIYDDEYKILETTNGILWNATGKEPISIAKSRINDYVTSTEPLDVEEENNEEGDLENGIDG